MPEIDINNPAVIKFLIESYEKTDRLRMKWKQIHGASLEHAATLQREEKGYIQADVLKASMEAGMAATNRDFIAAARNRKNKPMRDGVFIPRLAHLRKGHSIPEVGLGDVKDDPRLGRPDTDMNLDPKMRVIDPEQKEIIYKDLPFYGREVYLKSRVKILPENRYYFRETSGWEYGWRLKDSAFNKNAPKFGRVWQLTKDSKSLTGPQPDPHHYNEPAKAAVSKCTY